MNFDKYKSTLVYRDNREAYNRDTARLEQQFKMDLFEIHNVELHPRRDQCYALAWQYGHANGLHDVASYFEELVTLIK